MSKKSQSSSSSSSASSHRKHRGRWASCWRCICKRQALLCILAALLLLTLLARLPLLTLLPRGSAAAKQFSASALSRLRHLLVGHDLDVSFSKIVQFESTKATPPLQLDFEVEKWLSKADRSESSRSSAVGGTEWLHLPFLTLSHVAYSSSSGLFHFHARSQSGEEELTDDEQPDDTDTTAEDQTMTANEATGADNARVAGFSVLNRTAYAALNRGQLNALRSERALRLLSSISRSSSSKFGYPVVVSESALRYSRCSLVVDRPAVVVPVSVPLFPGDTCTDSFLQYAFPLLSSLHSFSSESSDLLFIFESSECLRRHGFYHFFSSLRVHFIALPEFQANAALGDSLCFQQISFGLSRPLRDLLSHFAYRERALQTGKLSGAPLQLTASLAFAHLKRMIKHDHLAEIAAAYVRGLQRREKVRAVKEGAPQTMRALRTALLHDQSAPISGSHGEVVLTGDAYSILLDDRFSWYAGASQLLLQMLNAGLRPLMLSALVSYANQYSLTKRASSHDSRPTSTDPDNPFAFVSSRARQLFLNLVRTFRVLVTIDAPLPPRPVKRSVENGSIPESSMNDAFQIPVAYFLRPYSSLAVVFSPICSTFTNSSAAAAGAFGPNFRFSPLSPLTFSLLAAHIRVWQLPMLRCCNAQQEQWSFFGSVFRRLQSEITTELRYAETEKTESAMTDTKPAAADTSFRVGAHEFLQPSIQIDDSEIWYRIDVWKRSSYQTTQPQTAATANVSDSRPKSVNQEMEKREQDEWERRWSVDPDHVRAVYDFPILSDDLVCGAL